MTEATTIKLKYPFTYKEDRVDGGDERHLTEVTIPSRIKAKHLRAMDRDEGEVGKVLALLRAVTGLAKDAINNLDAEDVATLTEALNRPLGVLPATGPKELA